MPTETADPRFAAIDRWPTEQAVAAMLDGQRAGIEALAPRIDAIARAAEAAAQRLRGGNGRLVYAGAGTSGRVAVQDGVELTPTFNWPRARLVFLVAGGTKALIDAVEGAEDDEEAVRREIAEAGIGAYDVAIGVAASGRTRYTLSALDAARAAGALTIGIANNPDTPILAAAEHAILLDTGSEAIAGSTRMQAGTAQKAALNLLSTAIMLRLGLVCHGRMVNMRISNAKLLARGQAMVAELAGSDAATAAAALAAAENDIRLAVLIATGLSPEDAAARLAAHHGDLGSALGA